MKKSSCRSYLVPSDRIQVLIKNRYSEIATMQIVNYLLKVSTSFVASILGPSAIVETVPERNPHVDRQIIVPQSAHFSSLPVPVRPGMRVRTERRGSQQVRSKHRTGTELGPSTR